MEYYKSRTCSNDPINSFVCVAKLMTGLIILDGVVKRNIPQYCPLKVKGTYPISNVGGTLYRLS